MAPVGSSTPVDSRTLQISSTFTCWTSPSSVWKEVSPSGSVVLPCCAIAPVAQQRRSEINNVKRRAGVRMMPTNINPRILRNEFHWRVNPNGDYSRSLIKLMHKQRARGLARKRSGRVGAPGSRHFAPARLDLLQISANCVCVMSCLLAVIIMPDDEPAAVRGPASGCPPFVP